MSANIKKCFKIKMSVNYIFLEIFGTKVYGNTVKFSINKVHRCSSFKLLKWNN